MTRILLIVILLLSTFVSPVYAQTTSSGLAISATVSDEGAQDGDIVCVDKDVFALCKTEYDKAMFGVIADTPAASIETTGLENAKLVLSDGKTRVRVSSRNGNIAIGDFITSSTTSGVGQKADKNGYVLGAALEAYESTNPDDVGKILVTLNIRPQINLTGLGQNLIQTLREGLAAPFLDPISALRYFSASAIIITSFVLGFIYFGRVAKAGVEAIGRNPLAGGRIRSAVLFHIILTVGIAAVGLGIAYLILSL